ncbi:hypothetical protein EW026_g599 [Hermanssonia centrifuga]|uniref:Terpene synthase n=1 Tax=Hermanssonia centrifuga TaxID=98765 RepID=A0A4S4KU58_9APHY|nr:hypothetical protein EW026_g599 [Hermanssonia centrifuga]
MAETSSSSMTFISKHLNTAILNFKCFCGMGRQHPSYSVVEYIILPNLTLDVPYSLRCNPYTKEVSAVSDEWLISLASLSPTQEREFRGLHAGLLCGSSYVDCEAEQLRAVTDFTSFLFCLDDWSDEFDTAGTKGLAECVLNTLYHPDTYFADAVVWRVTNDFWTRMLETIGPRCADRFIERMDMYFQAVMQQASDRELGTVPDLDTYIPLRRDTSGCKAGFTLIEYSLNIELLDDIAEHPVIRDLEDAANDAISWQNVGPNL